jgi:hypothetical protein
VALLQAGAGNSPSPAMQVRDLAVFLSSFEKYWLLVVSASGLCLLCGV